MSVARMGPRGWLVLGLLGVLVLPSACDPLRGGPREAIAEEEDEEVTLQVTVWQKGYEIFLEHLPIVAGEPVTFITHVTDLEALLPRSEGPVTFVLRDGASPPIERTDPAPARAGIYTPALEFPRTGTWSVALRIPDLPPREGETLVELPPFVVHADRATAGQAPVPEAPDGISFLKEQQWKVRTRTEPATGRTMVERLVLPGEVSASPRRRAVVTAPLAGHLLAPVDGQLPSLGERVEAGMALAVVRPPLSSFAVGVVEAEAEVIEARLALDLAERTHERVRLLAEDRTRSEADLQEAAFERDAARARLEAAEAKRAAYRKAGAIRLDE